MSDSGNLCPICGLLIIDEYSLPGGGIRQPISHLSRINMNPTLSAASIDYFDALCPLIGHKLKLLTFDNLVHLRVGDLIFCLDGRGCHPALSLFE